jgi:hypothetical protein
MCGTTRTSRTCGTTRTSHTCEHASREGRNMSHMWYKIGITCEDTSDVNNRMVEVSEPYNNIFVSWCFYENLLNL